MTASSRTIDWGGVAFALGLALFVLFVFGVLGFMIYSVTNPGPYAAAQFQISQMVRMKAFGNEGMVVRARCPRLKYGSTCTYDVRFSAMQLRTNVALFGADGPIEFAPVALVRGIREFELVRVR